MIFVVMRKRLGHNNLREGVFFRKSRAPDRAGSVNELWALAGGDYAESGEIAG